MHDEPVWYLLLWRRLRDDQPNLIVRLGLSLVAALALIAASVLAAWVWALLVDAPYVRDDWIGVSLIAGSIVWAWLLYLVWRPMRRVRHLVAPILITIGAIPATGGALFLIDEWLRRPHDEILMAAAFFAACTVVTLVWVVAFERVRTRRNVLDPDGIVQVNCPGCGYSLVGQRELRCSECGLTFTIDELIRAQGYGPKDDPPSTP